MLRLICIMVIACAIALPVTAQDNVDYAIRNIRSRFSDDNQQVEIKFEVWNIGAPASETATATLNVIATGQQVATDVVAPLRAQEIVTVTLTFPASLFEMGTVESFRAAVGVGEVEAEGSADIGNNFAQISVTFPVREDSAEAAPDSAATAPQPTAAPDDNVLSEFLDNLNIRVNWNDPAQVALVVGVTGAVLILLLILLLVVRSITQRTPDFANWLPPYLNMPMLDPNTLPGRRQQWQMHAQNSSIPLTGNEGAFHIRKLPTDLDGKFMGDWRVLALRLSHFDQYGRIHRSQTFATQRTVNRVNRVLRQSERLSREQLQKRLQPAARRMVRQFRSKLSDRTVMLPIVLDVRLRGRHGDVKVRFELYQFMQRYWALIDHWEPEMVVTSKLIYESATYTLYGQRPNESSKDFRARLQVELTQLLAELIAPATVSAPVRADQPTNPHLERVP
ncbi:MAG: hypothetical protein JNJ61_09400 [Anaerolineae bacterium]|nr:hypothetical protein [Anaerolineae bacterium]